MIVRMSKIEILGPKLMAVQVVDTLGECGVLHLKEHHGRAAGPPLTCLADNPNILSQQIYYRDARSLLDSILRQVPETELRDCYLSPPALLPALLALAPRHREFLDDLHRDSRELQNSLQQRREQVELLKALAPLLGERFTHHHVGMIGVRIDKSSSLHDLREALSREFREEYEVVSAPFGEGTLAAAILLPRDQLQRLQEILETSHIPEQVVPSQNSFATLNDQIEALQKSCRDLETKIETTRTQTEAFALQWGCYYTACHAWVTERLAILQAHSKVKETARCFVIDGWLPRDELPGMTRLLEKKFSGEVSIQELEIHDHDLNEVPVRLQNSFYFKPFEVFTRLLPLPRYTSYDPTPFLGIFFPIFFGMILGDLGYALIIGALGAGGALTLKRHPLWQDICKILTVCAGFTALFGLLYGECFGEAGAHLLGLRPLLVERTGTLMPMLYFTLAVGTFHILTGLVLGAVQSFTHRHAKEGVFRFLSLIVVTALLALAFTFFYPEIRHLRSLLLISIGIAVPALIITGGFLAPLEMLKHIGHIISYTRIMAVGMTSVMLAYIANRLAGEAGSLAAGIAVAFLLHLFNLILGIFAPTVHSLRLHYVEFFSKFFEGGGDRYTPLKKS